MIFLYELVVIKQQNLILNVHQLKNTYLNYYTAKFSKKRFFYNNIFLYKTLALVALYLNLIKKN